MNSTETATCEGHQADNGAHLRPGRSYCVGPCTMTRTADEIYEDIRALALTVEPSAPTAPLAERLATAEAFLAMHRQRQTLWNELASALMRRGGGDPPAWGLAAALGAADGAMEQAFRSEDSVERLRELLAAEPVSR